MSEEAVRYNDDATTESALSRARRLAREQLNTGETTALVDAIIAAAVEAAQAGTDTALHALREQLNAVMLGVERRLAILEGHQRGEDRHTLALMAATLAATVPLHSRTTLPARGFVDEARRLLAAVEDALGIVRLTVPADDEAPR